MSGAPGKTEAVAEMQRLADEWETRAKELEKALDFMSDERMKQETRRRQAERSVDELLVARGAARQAADLMVAVVKAATAWRDSDEESAAEEAALVELDAALARLEAAGDAWKAWAQEDSE